MAGKENRFELISKQERLVEIKYLGMQTIPVNKIQGSVNRWRDFDHRFRAEDADKAKFLSILQAIEKDIILPPITVYKIHDAYYVIDGNHRVAAAKKQGQLFIDAEVKELIPPADSEGHILWRVRSRFEWKTGLELNFTEMASYERVMVYLRLYARQHLKKQSASLPLKEIALSWKEEVYDLIMTEINKDHIMEMFPQHTVDDLFLYILHHQLVKSRLQGRTINVTEAVNDFCRKRGSTSNKIRDIFNSFVFRKKCDTLCMSCANHCPEGLICKIDGSLQIKDRCNGCGSCSTGCANHNPTAYSELATSPTSNLPRLQK